MSRIFNICKRFQNMNTSVNMYMQENFVFVVDAFVIAPAKYGSYIGAGIGVYNGYSMGVIEKASFPYHVALTTFGASGGYFLGYMMGLIWPITISVGLMRAIFPPTPPTPPQCPLPLSFFSEKE